MRVATAGRRLIRFLSRLNQNGAPNAEQWFQTHARIVTIVSLICAAFILQLDTAEIYRQLRDQPKLVEALVKSAPGVLEQGGEIVEPSDTPDSINFSGTDGASKRGGVA